MTDLNYIECAGVRVPSDWTVNQLREALAKRNIRFFEAHEQEIMTVFGDAIKLKASLEDNISHLHEEIARLHTDIARLDGLIKQKQKTVSCPKCGMVWTEPPIHSSDKQSGLTQTPSKGGKVVQVKRIIKKKEA